MYRGFLSLVQLGVGHETVNGSCLIVHDPEPVDWLSIQNLSNQQGLSAIVLDGIEKLSGIQRPPKEILLNWIGSVMREESAYSMQLKVAIEMGLLLHQHNIRTYVLKGNTVSECYPKPNHRRSADLDCFLRTEDGKDEAWETGNAIIEGSRFEVRRNYYKNSTFILHGLTVENHKYLTPFRGNKRLTRLETLLQRMLREDKAEDRFEGTELYRPPVMVSALFMIEHAYSHFLHEGLNWRHVLDWMMFRKKHNDEIDWQQLEGWIDEYGFRAFYTSYYNLGKYLLGEIEENGLSAKDSMMLADIWAPLDIHETVDGVKGKLYLAGNTWRARWKYREFTDMSWLQALWIQVKGFLFIKVPSLE